MRRPALFILATLVACGGGSTGPTSTPTPNTGRTKTIPSGPYIAGNSYSGRNGYIQYIAGELPIIITAPHGGTLRPTEIPDRVGGTQVRDTDTDSLALTLANAIVTRTGKWPHVIITRLHRIKIDTNRDSAEATEGRPQAVTAWFEFHDFVDVARQAVMAASGKGFYIDLHGHGHTIQRLELGYLLSSTDLAATNATLDGNSAYEQKSSIRQMSAVSPLSFSDLLRGPRSFGAMLEAGGYPAVPSDKQVNPGSNDYFDGGYNTVRYGCRDSGTICGLQIECNFAGVRDTPANRAAFSQVLTRVLEDYLKEHLALVIKP